MTISSTTQLIARLHHQPNATGLNIYNPYFQDQSLDAIYLLFQNPDPAPLIAGLRSLNIVGAVPAGFEKHPQLPLLLDQTTPSAQIAGRICVIYQQDNQYHGHYQAGQALLNAIQEKTDTTGTIIAIVGSGAVARSLVLALQTTQQPPKHVHIYNRTVHTAQSAFAQTQQLVTVSDLNALTDARGNILINTSRIGSQIRDSIFTSEIISKFETIADVTFGNPHTNLIRLAEQQSKTTITGWDMFTHQIAICLQLILKHQSNIPRLRHFVHQGLATVNHGAVTK